MKNKYKLLFILTLVIVCLLYRFDSTVAMASAQADAFDVITDADPEHDSDPDAGTELEQDIETAAETETEQNDETTAEPESEQTIELTAESEPEQNVEPASDFVSSGTALIEWLEAHKDTGGTVKLSDYVVLEENYTYCPNGINRPSVFVDTDKYTITVTGEIELMSDNHLIFSGQPEGKSIFYVAEKGVLSMMGVAVESGQCALWQEEGAGLVIEDCHISGHTHYADTPFVIYQNTACIVVEKGQTVNDVLPESVNCTVNRQGQVSNNEPVPLSWNLEESEKQQAQRRRFQLQGSFLQAASAKPALCTVAYNDYPLTFMEVRATNDGRRYMFRGGYTKPEEALPITVISEYSFDGENWIVYDEDSVNHPEAGFFIGFRSEECDTAGYSNIYIRLQWNDNGTSYFSNVLCYAADNLECVEDIGGSRGGGTSIINYPDEPQKNADDTSSEDESAGQNTKRKSNSDNVKSAVSSDTNQTESGDDDIDQDTTSNGQSSNTGAPNVNTEQSPHTEQSLYAQSGNNNEDQPLHTESKTAGQSSLPKTDNGGINENTLDSEESIDYSDPEDAGKAKEVVVAAVSPYEEAVNASQIKEQTLYSDRRQGNNAVLVIGFVALSVIAGIVGFCIHVGIFRSPFYVVKRTLFK